MMPIGALTPQQRVIAWSAVLAVMVFGFFIVAVILKRRSGRVDSSGPSPPFTLDQLRRLHRDGQLTDQQYDIARQRVIDMSLGDSGANDDDESARDVNR